MADPIDTLVAELAAQFAIVHGAAVPFVVGNLAAAEHSAPPRVAFDEQGGDLTRDQREKPNPHDDDPDADPEDGPGGAIGTMSPELEVEVWGTTREEARTILFRLVLASDRLAAHFGVNWTRYQKADERHANNGVTFIATLRCEVDVPAYTPATTGTVQVQSYELTTSLEHTGSTDVTFSNPADA